MKDYSVKILFILISTLCSLNLFSQADLQVSNIQDFPSVVHPGEVVYYTFDLHNIGNEMASGNYTIRKYLSTSRYQTIDDIEVGVVPTGNTPVGVIEGVIGAITIPQDYTNAKATLYIVVDADDQIEESDEGNNGIFSQVFSIQFEYQEVECQHNFGFQHQFLCQNEIDGGYEIYTQTESSIYRHEIDYDANILSTELHEEITNLVVNHDDRKLEEIDGELNVLNSQDLPDYLFDEHDSFKRVVQLTTGEYLFYYTLKTYPPIGFSSTAILIKTDASFNQIALYDDIVNEDGNAPNDGIEGVHPTADGGFYVDYEFNRGTWSNTFWSYLVKYEADGSYDLLNHMEAYDIKMTETPCGVKRADSYLYSSVYSGVNNTTTYWNNNAGTKTITNSSWSRGAYTSDGAFFNTNISVDYSDSHQTESTHTITVTDGSEPFVYSNSGFGGYILKGTGPTFLAFKTIDDYLTISQFPCNPDTGTDPDQEPESDCMVNVSEIESLDFTPIGSFGNSEYFISNNADNMYSIEALLDEYNYELVCIESAEENEFLSQHLSTMTYIGLNDAAQENTLSWKTGEALNYLNFDDDCSFCGTNNELNDHVIMNQWNGKWSWTNPWSNRPYIIEVACDAVDAPKPFLRMGSKQSITETTALEEFTIFPNPSSDFINVSFDSKQDQEITLAIYDGLGAKIHEQVEANAAANGSVQINVSAFPTGVYFVHLFDESHKAIKKFVKQ